MSNDIYPFRSVEKKWQSTWDAQKTYKIQRDPSKKKAYVLEMLPYPSGRIHMGHVRNYAIGDAIARYYRSLGYNVLHPMGWDAFGLPAENAAIQHKKSASEWTYNNIQEMKKQLLSLGFAYDWDREIATCHPSYYGHEQKLFLDFYKKGLIERKESWVNWDPEEQSVLANEQVINGRGWRSGALVEKKQLFQWFFKITNYADELLESLDTLDGWPEKVVKMQQNWIGKSSGAIISFKVTDQNEEIKVYSSRPETLFGASFCAIAPDHPLATKWKEENSDLNAFVEECMRSPTTEEAVSTREKKGIFTGYYITHPFDDSVKLPIYVANFVLMDYGTGAIFGCPAHDERDYDFAMIYNLPILPVIKPEKETDSDFYDGDGNLINSSFLDGLSIADAKIKVIEELKKLGKGEKKETFRLRDWGISRQRYWGCPIPVIHCEKCGIVPCTEDNLPILPENIDFSKSGNPLDNHPTWKHTTCTTCQGNAVRETDTLDTFFESCWYFLRYCSPRSDKPMDKDDIDYWLPVDCYVGGIEHAILHLLYARFFTKVLRDCGYVGIDEPFKNLLTQGMVCHQTYQDSVTKEWLYPSDTEKTDKGCVNTQTGNAVILGRSEKMSKSKKNLVDPQEIIESYGADAARLFILSDTPPDKDFDWNTDSIDGAWRYLNKIWRLKAVIDSYTSKATSSNSELEQKIHQTIAKCSEGYKTYALNKVVAFIREFSNTLETLIASQKISKDMAVQAYKTILQLLNPLVPHITSEIWELLGSQSKLVDEEWPIADPMLAALNEVIIAVQVNGKMRGTFISPKDSLEKDLEANALTLPTVLKELAEGKSVKRVIVVPNRIVNVIIQ